MREPLTADALARSLATTGRCVEAGLGEPAAVPEDGLAVRLTTRSAHALGLASCLAAAAAARWSLGPATRQRLDVVLHEGIANAILHGNLAIGPTAGVGERFDRIERALADPTRAGRAVEVTLAASPEAIAVAIGDEGGGFDLAAQLARRAGARAQSGRGLGLIRDVADDVRAEDGGRRLVVRLEREKSAGPAPRSES